MVVFVALTAIMMTVAFAEGEAEYVSNFYASPLSLLPPVIAIILALITKEVYSSLFVGILVGGLLYANFNQMCIRDSPRSQQRVLSPGLLHHEV